VSDDLVPGSAATLAPVSTPPRPMSGLERVWLVADRLLPPFVIQLVLEGQGRLPVETVRQAVVSVATALPGLRVRGRGWLGHARWQHDGPLPRVRQVDAPGWDGQSQIGAPFLADRLSAAGPVAEVVLAGPRVVFRALHAAMDGQGLLLFAQSLFSTLRGEAVAPAVGAELSDMDLVLDALARGELRDVPWNPPPPRDARPACALGRGPGTIWRRARVDGHPSDLLPRLISALGPGRIDVPVDLRRHRPDLRTTANLTGLVRVSVGPPPGSPARVADRLRQALTDGEHATFVEQGRRVRGLPLWVVHWFGQRAVAAGQRTGHVTTTATITNLGRLDHVALSCGAWTTSRAFILPPGSPDLAALIAITGDDQGVELCVACPTGGDPGAVLARSLAAIRD